MKNNVSLDKGISKEQKNINCFFAFQLMNGFNQIDFFLRKTDFKDFPN